MTVSKMPAIMFMTLNLMDAYLTKAALVMGATEINPFMTSIGGNIIVKGLIAIALVFILYCFKKERVLWPLNFIFLGIVLWNLAGYAALTLCKLGYVVITL